MLENRVYRGDTAPIDVSLFDEDGISPIPVTDVSWQIRKPDGTVVSGGPSPIEVSETTISFSDTDDPGVYTGQITFTLPDTTKRSSIVSFEVVDPLETTNQSSTPIDGAVDFAWMKLEDMFDSQLGGPYLRDVTKNGFDREKLKRFLPSALYYVNNYYQPATGYDDTTFPFDQHTPLLAQALLVEGIRHLMRSYVEQPSPAGPGQPSWFDRRNYLDRWKIVLQDELNTLNMWLDLFKRDQMGFGDTSILVGGYASYTNRVPRYMRGRYPYIYRW